VVTQYVTNLEQSISKPRLDRYRSATADAFETAVTYLWNVALSEALLQGLAALEIALRNTVHRTLAAHIGTEYWFQGVLKEAEMNLVHETWCVLSKRHKRPPTPGRIIAELTFGFWPPIFSSAYHDLWWSNSTVLFQSAFPSIPTGLPPHQSIVLKDVYQRVEACHKLRNRVMHHEPIFTGLLRLNMPTLSLPAIHQYIVDLLTWIHPDLLLSLETVDRFDHVFANGKSEIATNLRAKILARYGAL
jgi:hypothetical protein